MTHSRGHLFPGSCTKSQLSTAPRKRVSTHRHPEPRRRRRISGATQQIRCRDPSLSTQLRMTPSRGHLFPEAVLRPKTQDLPVTIRAMAVAPPPIRRVSVDDIFAARERIAGVAVRTP